MNLTVASESFLQVMYLSCDYSVEYILLIVTYCWREKYVQTHIEENCVK